MKLSCIVTGLILFTILIIPVSATMTIDITGGPFTLDLVPGTTETSDENVILNVTSEKDWKFDLSGQAMSNENNSLPICSVTLNDGTNDYTANASSGNSIINGSVTDKEYSVKITQEIPWNAVPGDSTII